MNGTANDLDTPLPRGRKQRRLSDHILLAFHCACDEGELDFAERLLAIAEFMLWRPLQEGHPERRVGAHPLVAAYERLWDLRHFVAIEGGRGREPGPRNFALFGPAARAKL